VSSTATRPTSWRVGPRGRAFSNRHSARCDAGAWPYPLLRCLNGGLSRPTPSLRHPTSERTDACLWLGINGSRGPPRAGPARPPEVSDQGDSSSYSIHIARAVLRRVGGTRPSAESSSLSSSPKSLCLSDIALGPARSNEPSTLMTAQGLDLLILDDVLPCAAGSRERHPSWAISGSFFSSPGPPMNCRRPFRVPRP